MAATVRTPTGAPRSASSAPSRTAEVAPSARRQAEDGYRGTATATFAEALVASKLARPVTPVAPVPRPRLIERLDEHLASPIVAIVAPAGYGKSTLLSQWVASGKRRSAWLTVDRGDNDPAELVSYLDLAFRRAGIDGRRPFVLVVDNAEQLTNPDAIAQILALAGTFAPGTQVAIGSRTAGNWPIPRLCASANAFCLGARDLMLTDEEAGELLARTGLPVPRTRAREANRAADGWAAGLYLGATESQKAGSDWLDGEDLGEMLAEYVRGEVLRALDPQELEFLLQTSMVDRLEPSLCDAVLERPGSREMLRKIFAADGPLVGATDGASYHLPAMIRAVLRLDLERSGGEATRLAHARAKGWYEAQGLVVDAAAHAARSLDRDELARLLPAAVRRALANGRSAEAADWARQLEASGTVAPELGALVALVYASVGDGPAAERWSERAWAAAASGGRREPLAEAAIARSLVCQSGWRQMRSDAKLALRLLPAGDDDVPIAQLLLGVADLLADEPERAEAGLARASRGASAVRDYGWATVIALAFRASLANASHRRPVADALLREARAIVIRGGLDREPAGVLVRALGARMAASRGLYAQARGDLETAQANARVATAAIPWLAVRARLDIAAAQLSLSDLAGAAATLDDVHELLRERPRLGILEVETERLDDQLRLARAMSRRDVALTAAELRLLPYLATHLGMSEIAERLYVSTNTVKTEAKSIYRKLAVSCRSEAVERATKVGLLETPEETLSGVSLAAPRSQLAEGPGSAS